MSGSHEKKWSTSWSIVQVLIMISASSSSHEPRRHSLEASVAIRSKISLTNELRIAIALFEIPVSGCTCLSTIHAISRVHDTGHEERPRTLVDVRRIGLLANLPTLLLIVTTCALLCGLRRLVCSGLRGCLGGRGFRSRG